MLEAAAAMAAASILFDKPIVRTQHTHPSYDSLHDLPTGPMCALTPNT